MKTKPIIAQTEIISRSIRSIEKEIDDLNKIYGSEPSYADCLNRLTTELQEKLVALKQMYYFETGTNY